MGKEVKFILTGFHPALFISDVDEYFTCGVCYRVAKEPLTCKGCETVYCSECVEIYDGFQCGGCAEQSMSFRGLRRFPLEVYEELEMYCINYNAGCRDYGVIEDILAHREECDYTLTPCLSPLCAKQLLKKGLSNEPFCGYKCKELYEFSVLLGKTEPIQYFEYFMKCLAEHKDRLIKCIEREAQEIIDNSEKLIPALTEETEKLVKEAESMRGYVHTGKCIKDTWKCCDQPKISLGCHSMR